jgi:hypothetical protein
MSPDLRARLRPFLLACLALGCVPACGRAATAGPDPLPSWKDTPPKRSIVAFVQRITAPGSPDFVPASERIATLDNDGTLWGEKPVPVQLTFAVDRVKAMAPLHAEWKTKQPFASVLAGDVKGVAAVGEEGVMEILAATHSGMTTDEFALTVQDWIASAKHPDTGRAYTAMVYQPMLELLAYLRGNAFKTYIVSGGGVEFMRPWTERVYGVTPEQVVGSSGKLKLEARDGKPVLVKLAAIELVDDKDGKPIAIHGRIGRRPIAAFGNSDGDLQMLQWATAEAGARFALVVHHDDAKREYAYDRADKLAKLDRAWDEAVARGWTVVSMKTDWSSIYPPVK